jgi:drug/metabolite transporter (DMT)-like permease
VAALVVAVCAVSSSGPLIAYADAPALAIAAWRNIMAVAVLIPVALLRRREELRGLLGETRREGLLCVLAGVFLAVHFSLWVPSIKLTTVAMGTALVATQPVWQGLIAVVQGRRLPGLTWLGIGTAMVGVIAATGVDLAASPTAVLGDVMALAGGLAVAIYTAIGERARVALSTTTYTTVCYSVCAALLTLACLASRAPLGGYPATAWLALAGLTIGPQLLGHSLLNFSLRQVSATTVSVLVLLELPGAAFIGWAWLGQTVRAAALPGLAALVAGVAIVILAGRRAPTPAPATID